MPIHSTVATRLPFSWGNLESMQDYGDTPREKLPNVHKGKAGVVNSKPLYTPALSIVKDTVVSPLLLMISDDHHLSRSREPLLGTAGFEVITVSSTQFKAGQFADRLSVVVFCQTISTERARTIAAALRNYAARIRTVRITRNPLQEQATFNYVLESPVPPAVLAREAINLRNAIANQENIH